MTNGRALVGAAGAQIRGALFVQSNRPGRGRTASATGRSGRRAGNELPGLQAPPGPPAMDWSVTEHGVVESTQTLARGLPAWSAVVAATQTGGRGQAERTFVSDAGGLYLTAVLPYDGNALRSRGFALAVGWAVRETLRRAGVRGLRLRWPNDLMVGDRKVGGILVEQGGRATLLVGIGLNVTNRPWLAEPSLVTVAGRLADATAGRALPERARLIELLLGALRVAQGEFSRRQLAGFVRVLNRCWGRHRHVRLEPASGVRLPAESGRFHGIDPEGRVLLYTGEDQLAAIPAHLIGRLREVREPA